MQGILQTTRIVVFYLNPFLCNSLPRVPIGSFCYTTGMKILKFTSPLCQQILAGSKTTTWRLFDDKDLQAGDELTFVNKDTAEPFGAATITAVHLRTLGTLEEADWDGHERFASTADMYKTYREYYGDHVTPETPVKIISFAFTAN